jgi:hypothetical protein
VKPPEPASYPGGAGARRGSWLRGAIALGLVAATFAVYGRVAGHDFVDLDDRIVIVQNPLVLEGVTPASVLRASASPPKRTGCR